MLRLAILGLTLLLASGVSGEAPPLQVTYVANCGFLLESGEARVIIDGLLASGDSRYYHLPDSASEALMRSASPPFDRIDVILVTHAHADHFDPSVVADHMSANSESFLIGPPQVRDSLQELSLYPNIADRVTVIPVEAESLITVVRARIEVDALPSKHSSYEDLDSVTGETFDRHASVQNLEFRVRMAGRVAYHCGDATINDYERYRSYGFGESEIDLAMIDFWDERDRMTFTQKLVHDVIRPRAIAMMHMYPDRPPRGAPEKQDVVAPRILRGTRLMQTWTLD